MKLLYFFDTVHNFNRQQQKLNKRVKNYIVIIEP